MGKIIGVGGVFLMAKDPTMLNEWYKKVLGVESIENGAIVFTSTQHPSILAYFGEDTQYFSPSTKGYMINLVVQGIDELRMRLEGEKVEILDYLDEPQGKFLHFLDPEGNKIELWEQV